MTEQTLSEELTWRGFVNQSTFADLKELDDKKRTFYHGFDASADSQTIGNLAAMMFDKVFLRHGYKAILVAGGSTSLVGDPGGKDKERQLQDEDTIARNVKRAALQLRKVFLGQDYILVNNLDWTKDIRLLPFLRDIGKHFSMTPLVQRDYIAQRMNKDASGISYAEFSYTLLQGYDYLHLYDTYGCTLQLGGSDQWGNCLSGVELIRRLRGTEVDVLTLNLVIDKATGKKFGKSEGGAIWLDPEKTSPFKFYQFWLNVDDASVEDYLKIFTELDKETINSIMNEFKNKKSARSAQKVLAYEVTKTVHGQIQADEQKKIAEIFFETRDFHGFTAKQFEPYEKELPFALVHEGDSYIDALVATGLASSRSDARRLIESDAVSVSANSLFNITANELTINSQDFLSGYLVIFKGKQHLGLLRIQ